MSQIIVFAQLKGGVGKTTLAVAVAAELAERGLSVALIDADPQGSAGQWASPGQLPCNVYAMPLRDTPVQNWIRAARAIAADYIVIDTAPDANTMIAPIALANVTVVPCTPSGLDIETTARTLEIVRKVRRTMPEKRCLIVPNRVDARTLEGRQFVEELERLGERVLQVLAAAWLLCAPFRRDNRSPHLNREGSQAAKSVSCAISWCGRLIPRRRRSRSSGRSAPASPRQ
jgi:chromosome partitioning protein